MATASPLPVSLPFMANPGLLTCLLQLSELSVILFKSLLCNRLLSAYLGWHLPHKKFIGAVFQEVGIIYDEAGPLLCTLKNRFIQSGNRCNCTGMRQSALKENVRIVELDVCGFQSGTTHNVPCSFICKWGLESNLSALPCGLNCSVRKALTRSRSDILHCSSPFISEIIVGDWNDNQKCKDWECGNEIHQTHET